MNAKENKVAEPIFKISRTFDAPIDLVWKAMTELERMAQWWGPKGFKTSYAKMDFKVGGMYHYCITSPDGHDIWGKMVYQKIVKPTKIIFVNSFSDKNAGVTRHPMNEAWPLEMLSTFTFVEDKGKTTFTVEWSPIKPTESERKTFEEGTASMNQGWTGTLERLNEYLS